MSTNLESTSNGGEKLELNGQAPEVLNLINSSREDIKEELKSPEFDKVFNESISLVECPESGTVRKIDISPENPKDVIFLSSGWLETLESNKYLIKSFYDYGYRIVSLQHPRKGGRSKNPKIRRLSAIESVLNDTKGPKMQVLAHSLGAIDIVEFTNSDLNPDAHKKFKNFIFTNPCGLTAKKHGRQLLKLAKNYALKHMKQKKEIDEHIKKLTDEKGVSRGLRGNEIPTSEIATEIRNEMDTRGGEEFGIDLKLSAKEGVYIATSHIQKKLKKLRKEGHSIFVFSSMDDRLVPRSDYGLKISNNSPKDPELKNLEGIEYVEDGEADVDQVIALAGYHNSPRNIDFRDTDNPQFMTHVWIDALLSKLKSEE